MLLYGIAPGYVPTMSPVTEMSFDALTRQTRPIIQSDRGVVAVSKDEEGWWGSTSRDALYDNRSRVQAFEGFTCHPARVSLPLPPAFCSRIDRRARHSERLGRKMVDVAWRP